MHEAVRGQSFSVEDIRRIREEAELRYQEMSPEEITHDIHEGAKVGLQIIDEIRREKALRQAV